MKRGRAYSEMRIEIGKGGAGRSQWKANRIHSMFHSNLPSPQATYKSHTSTFYDFRLNLTY
jgi:hypothetical protein